MFETEIQKKNRNVSGINAPSFNEYPEGRIDTDWLPLAITLLVGVSSDNAGAIITATYKVYVYLNPIGQGTWVQNKVNCQKYMLLFLKEYSPSTGFDWWIKSNPGVKMNPASLSFSSYENTLKAPDEEEFHGFTFEFEVTYHLDAVC